MLLGCRVWAAAGVLLALTLELYWGLSEADATMWQFPSSTILRSPLDVWMFMCLLRYARTGWTRWAGGAALLAGLGVLFETDTGLDLVATFLAFWLFRQAQPDAASVKLHRQLGVVLASCGAAIATVLAGLWVASRGTALQPAFWRGWMESVLAF